MLTATSQCYEGKQTWGYHGHQHPLQPGVPATRCTTGSFSCGSPATSSFQTHYILTAVRCQVWIGSTLPCSSHALGAQTSSNGTQGHIPESHQLWQ